MSFNITPKDESYEDSTYENQSFDDQSNSGQPTPPPTAPHQLRTAEGLVIESAKAHEKILLMDNLMSDCGNNNIRFRWTFFLAKVRKGEFDKGMRIVIPLDYKKNSNNARRCLHKAGLEINKDYAVLRQAMPSGEEFIAIVFL